MQPIHDTLAESLKRLRTEESFLVVLLERARTGSATNPDLLHVHRRELARVRDAVQYLLPEALLARDTCARRLEELHPQAEALRDLLEQIRSQARGRTIPSATASARARALEAQLEKLVHAIAARERELHMLDELLPGAHLTGSARRLAARGTVAGQEGAANATAPRHVLLAGTATPAPVSLRVEAAPPVAPSRAPATPPPVVAPHLLERRARPSAAALIVGEESLLDHPAGHDFELDVALGLDDSISFFDLAPDVAEPDFAERALAGDDDFVPALGDAFDEGSGERFDDPLLDRSRAVFATPRHERRGSRRLPYPAPMKFRSEGMSFAARCCDVSRGGMFLETSTPPETGSTVTVVFCAEGYPMEIDAEVMYRSPGVGVGVRFQSVPEDERPYLEGLLSQLGARSR